MIIDMNKHQLFIYYKCECGLVFSPSLEEVTEVGNPFCYECGKEVLNFTKVIKEK